MCPLLFILFNNVATVLYLCTQVLQDLLRDQQPRALGDQKRPLESKRWIPTHSLHLKDAQNNRLDRHSLPSKTQALLYTPTHLIS